MRHTRPYFQIMRTKAWRASFQWVCACLVATLMAGCMPKAIETLSVYDLYDKAQQAESSKSWSEAAKYYEELETRHSYSSLSEESLYKAALNRLRGNEPFEAAQLANRYVNFYPVGAFAPEASYLLATSSYNQIYDTYRETGILNVTQRQLNDFIRAYPNRPEQTEARARLRLVRNYQAHRILVNTRYMLLQNHSLASLRLSQELILTYPETIYAEESLYRIVEASLRLGLDKEAIDAVKVLHHNYPCSSWGDMALNQLEKAKLWSPVLSAPSSQVK